MTWGHKVIQSSCSTQPSPLGINFFSIINIHILESLFDATSVTPNWIWGENNYGFVDPNTGEIKGSIGKVNE